MVVLVTGGAGFIGSHVAEQLLEEGHEVRVIDNLSTGRIQNITPFSSNPKFTFIEADINDPKVESCFSQCDWVIHLAALADIVPSIERPIDYFRANVTGTLSILEHARKFGIKRLVYAASSSCYGLATQIPTPETAPIRPEYPYAVTKYLGEEMVLNWGKIYKLPVVSLRFFNVYGPRSRTTGTYGAVFGVFLAQKLKGLPFTVVGDGKQSRDFTYVTDVANAVLTAVKSNVYGEIFNVGSGHHFTINLLVKLLKGVGTYIPKRPGEPDITFADISKIQRVLHWVPKTSFPDGVNRMLENINDWKSAPVWTPESIKSATEIWFKYLTPESNLKGSKT